MQARLNFLLLLILLPGLIIAGAVTFRVEVNRVEDDLLEEAGLLLDVMQVTRKYTNKEVTPLVQVVSADGASFHPQEVPSYAARAVTERLTALPVWAGYTVRAAVLAAMNPVNTARSWEVDIIQAFAEPGAEPEQFGRRMLGGETVMFMARPIRVPDSGSCLRCHASPAASPPAMMAMYPAAAGFGWKPGQVVGADIVTIPLRHSKSDIRRSVATLSISMISVFALMFMVLNAIVGRQLVDPLRATLSRTEKMSLGGQRVAPLDEDAVGEVGRLNTSINRLAHSLQRALDLASEHIGQDEPE